MAGGAHAMMKRIPRIKFPQRHPKPTSDSISQSSQHHAKSVASDVPQNFFSSSNQSNVTGGGKASLQPKRTPISQDEIEYILLGGVE